MTDVSILSDAFQKLREDFNKMMTDTLRKMQQKGSSDASLTIKIDIELEKTFAPVYHADGSQTMRDVFIPWFTHKVSSAMSIKSEVKGKYEEECELVFDEATGEFMLVPTGQMTLASEYEREVDDE